MPGYFNILNLHSINTITVKIRKIFFVLENLNAICACHEHTCAYRTVARGLKIRFAIVQRHPFRPFSVFCFRRHYDYILLFSACQSGLIHAIGIDLWIILTHVLFCARNNLNFQSRRIWKIIWQSYTRSYITTMPTLAIVLYRICIIDL